MISSENKNNLPYRYELYNDLLYRFAGNSISGQVFTGGKWKYSEVGMLLGFNGDGTDVTEQQALEHALNVYKSTIEEFFGS
jgi:hypothetical protein